ncbi:MAG: DUF262 domain-containing protein [Candidatus Nealsonbacteria bacterium]|nr:DUF262 domain-containing protein [Candidatus Nealsonbacteria bacterium]
MDKLIKFSKKREVESWKVVDLISKIESGELDLDTEYQRDIIWSKSKKALLIDSILKDIDIPKIYLAYFLKEKKYECIDGKQRIASVLDFYNNVLQTTSGERFKELPDKNIFLNYQFSVSIIREPTPQDISELFYRLNIGVPLNGGELIHAMRGDMIDFIFTTIGEKGPFIGKVGMKQYRFSREIALAQIIINSIFFRGTGDFVRARYEDLYKFLSKEENIKFDSVVIKKVKKIESILLELERIFGKDITRLNRKSAIVSAYLFCEEMIEKKSIKDLEKFPQFYLQLLDEIKQQANLIKKYRTPTKKILLERFQKNLQQASVEGYSIKRRQEFLEEAFTYYLKNGKIIGDNIT